MGIFSGWDLVLPGSTLIGKAASGDLGKGSSDNGASLGLTGDTATDEQLINGLYGPGKTWPEIKREDYILPASTGPENRGAVTGRAEEAWRAGAQNFWGRKAPVTPGVGRGFEMEAGRRQQGAQDVALTGVGATGRLADQVALDRNMYLNAARGTAPSAAELQMNQGLAQAMGQQLALASSTRSPGGAYQALAGSRALQRQSLADTAVLRAQEQERARDALTARDTMEANIRNAQVNQALGVSAGESQAYQNALALNAQELGKQKWDQDAALAMTGYNDAAALGWAGLSNDMYSTANEMEKTATTRDIAATDLKARWNEAQADVWLRWLDQWNKFKTAEKDRALQEKAAWMQGIGTGVTAVGGAI